jgi:hypothetical protein
MRTAKSEQNARQRKPSRQRPCRPHGNEMQHGKGSGHCRATPFAVRPTSMHGKVSFAVRILLCRAPPFILFFSFNFISSNIHIYFLISFTF